MTIVLVEGESDRIALEVIARRLNASPLTVVPIGGAHAAANAIAGILEDSPNEHLLGLVDIGERHVFEAVLPEVFVCDRDLEDELIRALGEEAALLVVEDQGELASFRTLQKQPAQRKRSTRDQLRQFLNGRSGNKARYAALFAEAIELDRIPGPLKNVIAAACKR